VWRNSVSPLFTEARSQRKKSLEPDGLFIKFKKWISKFIAYTIKYKYFDCICVVYFVYSKYLGKDEMGI
jgi:hypothetical protein